MTTEPITKGATISPDQCYRYQLFRTWDESLPKVLFIMLNPSTADGTEDDRTISRCIGFAKAWGYGGLMVGNLFAFRSTNPKLLIYTDDPVGPENNFHLLQMHTQCEKTICAWGNSVIVNRLLIKPGKKILSGFSNLYYLDLCKDGTPIHPLQRTRPVKHLVPKQFIISPVHFYNEEDMICDGNSYHDFGN